jgi:hypothetical protein
MMALTPLLREYTPRPWTYEDYLGATRRKDSTDNRKRWLEAVALLNTTYKDELDDAVYMIIKTVDEDIK